MEKVDEFTGATKNKEFLYLDEMLTRAMISLDDIDPDGNNDIRQARKALIKDINSKISLLEKKASAFKGKASESSTDVSVSAKSDSDSRAVGDGEVVSQENVKNSESSLKTNNDQVTQKEDIVSEYSPTEVSSNKDKIADSKAPSPAIPLPEK